MADRFDLNAKTQFVDIKGLAKKLYQNANGNSKVKVNPRISETSITHNQGQAQIHNYKWRGVDDTKIKWKPNFTKDSKDKIALDPQVIRTFEIAF